jgi:hypothetical protein
MIIKIEFISIQQIDEFSKHYDPNKFDYLYFTLNSYNINHFQFNMSKPSDEQLRQAIDAIFNKYDTDQSGTL